MSKKGKVVLPLLLFLLFAGVTLCNSTKSYAATVARIGNNSYSSLQKAVDAVRNNQTIRLQRNITQKRTINVKRNVKFTIDLQNHTITMKDYKRTYIHPILQRTVQEVDNGKFQIKKANVTIKNGTIKTRSNVGSVIDVSKNGKATLSGCNMTGKLINEGKLTINSGTYQYSNTNLIGNSGTLTINNGTFIGKGTCMSIVNNKYKCTIKNGTFTNKYEYGGLINNGKNDYLGKNASMSIKGGSFTAIKGTAINIYSGGKIDLSGGKIKGHVTVNEGGVFNMSGGSIERSIDQRTPVFVQGSFTMKGGTITAEKPGSTPVVAMQIAGGKANLAGGTVIGGATIANTSAPGNYTDYSVIQAAPSSVSKNGTSIINKGKGPDISPSGAVHRFEKEEAQN